MREIARALLIRALSRNQGHTRARRHAIQAPPRRPLALSPRREPARPRQGPAHTGLGISLFAGGPGTDRQRMRAGAGRLGRGVRETARVSSLEHTRAAQGPHASDAQRPPAVCRAGHPPCAVPDTRRVPCRTPAVRRAGHPPCAVPDTRRVRCILRECAPCGPLAYTYPCASRGCPQGRHVAPGVTSMPKQ